MNRKIIEQIFTMVEQEPNDMKLGSSVRHFIYQLENTEQDYKQWKQKWDTCNG